MSLQELRRLARGVKSLFVGLGVTGRAIAQPTVTVLYPRQEVDTLSSFRGHVELTPKEDSPSEPKCVACSLCAKACPSDCLTVLCLAPSAEGEEPRLAPAPMKGVRTPARFILDYSLCSMCGQCVAACASKSIRFSHEAYLVSADRRDFQIDLLERLRRLAAENASPTSAEPDEEAKREG